MATINGTNNFDVLSGTNLNDIMWGFDGGDYMMGKEGADEMHGGLGSDIYYVDNLGDTIHELAGEGTDEVRTTLSSFTLGANVENLDFDSLAAVNFTGTGNALNNVIEGGQGHDTLDGKGGADSLIGLGGDDTYWVDNIGDAVTEGLNAGTDTVRTTLQSYILGTHVENVIYHGFSHLNFIGVGNGLSNYLEGWGGNDTLDGGSGADTMKGMTGDDSYHVDHANDTIIEFADAGKDTVYFTLSSYTLGAHLENLTYNGIATNSVTATGNALDNVISTWQGNDTLNGGGGADTMNGGAGDDTYVVDNASDLVNELAGNGTDQVNTILAAYTLGANVEKLVYLGPSAASFAGTGNTLDNYIEGWGGADTLDGKAGVDTLKGMAGNDVYHVDNEDDVVVEFAGGGVDEVKATSSKYMLPFHVENLTYVGDPLYGFNAVGNTLDNVLIGGNSKDSFYGNDGNDTMIGLKGNDRYEVSQAGDVVVEEADGGIDTVSSALNTYTLPQNIENFERSVISLGDGDITGNVLDNVITGWDGNDTINGMGGADTMIGGLGHDVYQVDDAGDLVVEQLGQGADTIGVSLASYTLPQHVEKLIYNGAFGGSFVGTGNTLDNYLEGWGGADTLDGLAGSDTMVGYGGGDTYHVDNFGDVVLENANGGIDEVKTAIGSRFDYAAMYILPDHVENLTGTSALGQGVFANAFDNLVKMGDGGDLIVMQDGGADTVQAGGGDDFIHFGDAFTSADSVDGGAGYDTVGLIGNYGLSFTDTNLVNVEKLAVYSSGAPGSNDYTLTMADGNVAAGGNMMVVAQSLLSTESLTFDGSAEKDGNFNIRGGKGDDVITGGAKADQMWGNVGADTLKGGGGKDVFEYFAVEESTFINRDSILDFTAGDKINLKAIDADSNGANGNSKFAFLGDGAFTGAAGQVRAFGSNGSWFVEADVNGDSMPDLVINVTTTGGHMLGVADFYL